MPKPTLVIMAAGMGSRFGGLKQMTPVDDGGHFIMDYSIYDAIRAGFGKIVCVIKEEMSRDFEDRFGSHIRPHVPLSCAYQSLDQLPEGFSVPAGRTKPWGTGQAVLCAAGEIDGPFAVINADDYYGREAMEAIGAFLSQPRPGTKHAMVGYPLSSTLTESGYVSRGVCQVDGDGHLVGITERTHIESRADGPAYTEDGETYVHLPPDTVVSMNLWGFQRDILDLFRDQFTVFLRGDHGPLKGEFFLPTVPSRLIAEGRGTVSVLPAKSRWYGVTYQEDLPAVKAAFAAMVREGKYPGKPWA